MVTIRLEKAVFRLGGSLVFDNADWEIRRGEHWAILGRNGAGKTTLARALRGEIPLVSGSIHFFFDSRDGGAGEGRSWVGAGEIVRLSPDTPQALTGLYGGYHQARWQSFESRESPTVAELLGDIPTSGCGRKRAASARTMQRLGISTLMEKRILHLSNGEARKVAIARALLQHPRMMIFDDPFSGLDRSAKDNLRDVLDDLLSGETPQIVLVTHRMEEIPRGITHALLVDRMQVIAKGTREQILAHEQITGESPETAIDTGIEIGDDPAPGIFLPEPVIRMEDVSITYGDKPILRHIDWEVRPGEHWAVSGRNGAGKSTLLSLILADNPQAYANRIFLFGIRRGSGESIWEIKRRIGWVAPELQGYYPPRTTGFEVVCSGFFDTIGLYQACTPHQSTTARDRMRACGIDPLSGRRMSDMSTGEKRMVLLARALVKDPELLILDEPCQGLDPFHRREFIGRIDAIARQPGISLIYVTHHPDELPESISHVLALADGAIVHRGRKTG